MLAAYLTQTRALLQLPGTQSTSIYTDTDLTRWINTARGQLAGEAECIRAIATISTVQGQQEYQFSALAIPGSPANGVEGVINLRRVTYTIASGQIFIPGRPWEWFDFYVLNNPVPQQGVPASWAQYQQGAAPGSTGAAGGGSFYINPPDDAYQLNCDCVCYPIALVDDTTVEAIPYLFTDAVPFFAAYYALLSAQNQARMGDAYNYYKQYNEFLGRARKSTNATPNRWQFEQAGDPVQAAKIGLKGGGGGAG